MSQVDRLELLAGLSSRRASAMARAEDDIDRAVRALVAAKGDLNMDSTRGAMSAQSRLREAQAAISRVLVDAGRLEEAAEIAEEN